MNQIIDPSLGQELLSHFPRSVLSIFVTLSLSFLIGLEREEHSTGKFYNFGGVRTFPIIGLCGYLMARLTDTNPIFLSVGILVMSSLLWLSYKKKLELPSQAGMTSEVSGIFTFLLGALAYKEAYWETTTLAVIVLLLLELKEGLENLSKRIPSDEIFTFTRFLLITAVILPIVPNESFTFLKINPFHLWLIVVAISGLSYIAYVIDLLVGTRKSLLITAILGGIYSSTSITVVLAKRSKTITSSRAYSGAILIASGFMYFRLIALLSLFNHKLTSNLLTPFLILGIAASLAGFIWMNHFKDENQKENLEELKKGNPLELQSALIFALLFSVMGILTALTTKHFGKAGILSLSFLTGLANVDPFVMSLTQSAGKVVAMKLASQGIIIATASNNLIKGIYAAILGRGSVRHEASLGLIVFAFISLITLFFI